MMIRSQSYCFFCLVLLTNTFASPTPPLCRRDQRDALLELQKEFPINSNDNIPVTTTLWNKSVDCCSWDGVKCDHILGEVISLYLCSSTLALKTSLKSSSGLFKLQHLRVLDLSNCNLQGEIPSSIGNFSHLTSLFLSHNQLVGEIPASIGNLNQLETLVLTENHISGNIPTLFANLTKLSYLYLSQNQFTGGDKILANLTSLKTIDLSSNNFRSSISADLSGLHNLRLFNGKDNSFVRPFPTSLLMISSLTDIDLSDNQFEGPIDFSNTSSSSQLDLLDVSYNNIDGVIPESISRLRNLRILILSHNSFEGRVPTTISKLVNLYDLDLSHNKLKGQVPHSLWRLSNLGSIRLSHNSFTGFDSLVEVIDGASLGALDISSNSLQGPIPQWMCNLRSLTRIDLSNNHITGSVPGCLTYLESVILQKNNLSGFQPDLCINGTMLRSLDVSRNNLVGKLPKSLIHCKDLEFLNVRGNKIKDTFPFWLGSMRLLVVLVLRSNTFYGSIYNPSTYFGFPSIRIIDIADNKFVGSLPQDYFVNWTDMSKEWIDDGFSRSPSYVNRAFYRSGDSVDLVYKGVDTNFVRVFGAYKAIDFSGNQFCGNIPSSVGLLGELRLLNLSGNTFTGNIPSSLKNISNLETLDLSRNNLSGEIPPSLGNLSFLTNINFSYNHLEGLVPQSTQFGSQNCSSFTGNNGLYGLDKICGKIHLHVPPSSQQPVESLSEPKEPVLNWIAAAIAFGPGVFCGLVIGHIFTSYKHEWFITR